MTGRWSHRVLKAADRTRCLARPDFDFHEVAYLVKCPYQPLRLSFCQLSINGFAGAK